ncbi:hypothetical protein HK099_003984 [Clydaea vesicula]|uniref:Uncharacterized protein n=1 Tax=Clydaea vesicula TaxID=447962 RepID=A0AAD5XZX2_9FUNG|nr:hypothetical protein HK099_003984 [Clydaea vesicula]
MDKIKYQKINENITFKLPELNKYKKFKATIITKEEKKKTPTDTNNTDMFFPPLENNISSKAPFNNIRRSSILQKKLSLNQSQRRLSLIYGLVPPKKLTQCKANRYGLSPCKNLTDNENGYCEIKPHQDLAKLENLNECTEEEEDPECEGHWNFSKYGVTADVPSKPWDDSKKLYSEFVELSNFIKSDYIKEFNLITEGSVNENLSGSLTYISGWPKKCLGFYMILPKVYLKQKKK